jgi:hypothetical protein
VKPKKHGFHGFGEVKPEIGKKHVFLGMMFVWTWPFFCGD